MTRRAQPPRSFERDTRAAEAPGTYGIVASYHAGPPPPAALDRHSTARLHRPEADGPSTPAVWDLICDLITGFVDKKRNLTCDASQAHGTELEPRTTPRTRPAPRRRERTGEPPPGPPIPRWTPSSECLGPRAFSRISSARAPRLIGARPRPLPVCRCKRSLRVLRWRSEVQSSSDFLPFSRTALMYESLGNDFLR